MKQKILKGIRNPEKVPPYLRRKLNRLRSSVKDDLLYRRSLSEIRERMAEEEEGNLDDILDTVLDIRPGHPPYEISMMQLRDEIERLAETAKEEQPRTVLEIGTSNGGSFYVWSRYLDTADKIVSLDLPGGRFGGGYNKRKMPILREFAPEKEMSFVRANSHTEETYSEVAEIVEEEENEGTVDFLFIDGDHTYEGVKKDFEMYSRLVSDGGLIALHDIVHHPDNEEVVERRRREADDIEDRHLNWNELYSDCNVDRFWDELTERYETTEIISHPKQTWAGIGVVHL